MIDYNQQANGLYQLSDDCLDDAQFSRRLRNGFLVGFVALESITGFGKILGVNIPSEVFVIEASVTLLFAGGSELSRRLSLSMARDFKEGGRSIVELDMLANEYEWSKTIQEPDTQEPPAND